MDSGGRAMQEHDCRGVRERCGRRQFAKTAMKNLNGQPSQIHLLARVAKLVDATDLKSVGRNTVPVQVRPRAPFLRIIIPSISYKFKCWICIYMCIYFIQAKKSPFKNKRRLITKRRESYENKYLFKFHTRIIEL